MTKETDLELNATFAKLEGVAVVESCNRLYFCISVYGSPTTGAVYDPINDLALNCAARDKYEVNVTYHRNETALWIETTWSKVKCKSKQDIPRAVIECILKSKGLTS